MATPLRFRLFAFAVSLVFFLGPSPLSSSVSAQTPTLAELFQKGKTEFKLASYRSSLETFRLLQETCRQPGNEGPREKLEPIIAFYRGANLAALGETAAAKDEFESYLSLFPTAKLDPAVFPKQVIDLFNKTREEARRKQGQEANREVSADGSIAAAYKGFRAAQDQPTEPIDERWAEGAVRFLMTKGEKQAWPRISDSVQRAEFVSKFWQRRDPDPLTPENEYREEIVRRIQFADSHFAVGEKRGSETDRGMVFVLLGPPSYVGQRPLKSGDDSIQSARAAPLKEVTINPDGTRTVRSVPRTALTAETLQGTREIWYYRRDRLPKSVRFTEVNFEFITKRGFGTAVLQRDHEALTALEQVARASLPSGD